MGTTTSLKITPTWTLVRALEQAKRHHLEHIRKLEKELDNTPCSPNSVLRVNAKIDELKQEYRQLHRLYTEIVNWWEGKELWSPGLKLSVFSEYPDGKDSPYRNTPKDVEWLERQVFRL